MSLLGFDALGRWPLGSLPDDQQTITLTAAAGSFTVTAYPVSFTVKEMPSPGALVVAGVSASFTVSEPAAPGAFAFAPVAAALTPTVNAAAGAFTLSGQPVNEIILEAEGPATFTVSGSDARLSRTGFDYEFQQGGIGHLLMEMQRAKQLAAITRTIPPPVDRRTMPTFRPPLRSPVPSLTAPSGMAALQKQRMDEAAVAAKAAKKRREEEAILLLAS